MNGFDLSGELLVPAVIFIFCWVAFGFFLGSVVFKNNGEEIMRQQAIENNCAQYNPTNGTFEWVKK
jgi:hypothetical protein